MCVVLHLCMCVYFVASHFVLPVSLCPLGSPVSPSPGHPSLFEVAISLESKPAIKPILARCPFRIFTNGLLWAPRNKNNQNQSRPSCAIILCLLLRPPQSMPFIIHAPIRMSLGCVQEVCSSLFYHCSSIAASQVGDFIIEQWPCQAHANTAL